MKKLLFLLAMTICAPLIASQNNIVQSGQAAGSSQTGSIIWPPACSHYVTGLNTCIKQRNEAHQSGKTMHPRIYTTCIEIAGAVRACVKKAEQSKNTPEASTR